MPARRELGWAAAALLALGVAWSAPLPASGRYCQPLAIVDQRVIVGFQALIRPAPGCARPAYVRKINRVTGSVIGEPATVPVGSVERVWVFTHRLEYTLDGVTWARLVAR